MSQTQLWRYLTTLGAIAVTYFLTARLALSVLNLGIEASPLWPPAGIAIAALLWCGRWALLGVAIGMFWVNASMHTPWLWSAGSVLANTVQAVLAATLLQRVGFQASMERLRDVLGFVLLAVLAAPLVGATIGNLTAYLSGYVNWNQLLQNWWTVWLGDGMGVLVVAPWLLALRSRLQGCSTAAKVGALRRPQRLERLLWFVLLVAVSWAVFYSHTEAAIAYYPLEYLPFPLILWAALRFGQCSTICATFLLSAIAVSGTVLGYGPFNAKIQGAAQVMLLLQAFIGVMTVTALILAAATAERRQAQALLWRSKTSLANAQHLARLGNWDFEFEQRQWSWSDELYRLLGLPLQSVAPSQEALLQAVHPQDRDRVEQAIAHALEQRKPYQIEYRLLWPNGVERIVEEQVIVGPTSATGAVQDITERKQAEEQLRLTAERNHLLAETALRIRRSLDLDEILNTAVQEVQQLLKADRVFISQFDAEGNGRIVAEAVVPGWPSIQALTISPLDYAEIQAIFTQDTIRVVPDTTAIESSAFIAEYYDRYQVKASVAVPMMLDISSIAGPRDAEADAPDGLPSRSRLPDLPDRPAAACLFGILIVNQCAGPRQWQPLEIELLEQLGTQVAIALQQAQLYQQVQALNSNLERQVTERTLQLEASLTELEDLNKLQEVLLHAIAHDLRTTMMGSQMVFRNLLSQTGEAIPIGRSLLERMSQSGEVQLNKLNALIEAYACKTEGIPLAQEPASLASLLQEAIANLEPWLEQNQVRLVNHLSEHLPPVWVDAVQLKRVLQQLLTNAVKHNRPGVEIKLEAVVEAGQLRCLVADNGKGISPAQCNRLFELRLAGPQERQLTGISLGLYLCHQIITAHGGEMGVVSAPEQGSRFWFTVPLAAAPTSAPGF